MKVDINIVNAIDQYIATNHINQKEFAKICGVSETTLVKWRRQGSGITPIRWARLFKMIRQFLPASRIFVSASGEEQYSSLLEGSGRNDYFEPKFVPAMIPVLQPKDLLKYNAFVQNIEQFAFERDLPRIEFRPRVQSAGGIFCYQLEETQGGIPSGAYLYASTEAKPRQAQFVIAVTADKKIIVGRYSARCGRFNIGEMGGNLDSIRTQLIGLFPIIVYEVICA